jgi:GT2 family glycosyltransferase
VARDLGTTVIATENRGLGFLYNTGVRASTADFVFLANNDIALEKGTLRALVEVLEADDSRFAADARQLDWEGRALVHGHTTLRRGRLIREYLPGLRLDHHGELTSVAPTVCANGAAMLIRREMLLALDGFDETFFMEWEDLDLCWRAWLRGWPTMYVPHAVVRHRVGAATSESALPRRLASSHHNLMRFALKCLPGEAAARLVAGELLRLPRHPRLIGPALAAVLRELPAIARLRRSLQPQRSLFTWMLQGQPT